MSQVRPEVRVSLDDLTVEDLEHFTREARARGAVSESQVEVANGLFNLPRALIVGVPVITESNQEATASAIEADPVVDAQVYCGATDPWDGDCQLVVGHAGTHVFLPSRSES